MINPKIVGQGTHKELMEKGGYYKELYTRQLWGDSGQEDGK